MLQMKIREVNGNLSKHHKDLECKCYVSSKKSSINILVFEGNQCLSSAYVMLQWFVESNRFFFILKYYFPYMWYSF